MKAIIKTKEFVCKYNSLKLTSLMNFHVFLIVLSITSCAKKIYPTKPSIGIINDIKYKESSIALPFRIPVKEINDILNSKIPRGKFYHLKNGVGGFYRSDIECFRDSDISFTANGNKLRFNIPVRITVYGAKRKKIVPFPPVYVTKTGKGVAVANIYIETEIKMNSDCTFTTNTNLSYDLQQAVIYIPLFGNIVGPIFGNPKIKVSVKSLVRPELDKAIKKAIPNLNGILENKLNELSIKNEIKKHWKKLGEPIKLDENVWIESNPTQILFNNIVSDGKLIDIKAGVSSKLKLRYTENPYINDPEFPNLTMDKIEEGKFNIYLPTEVSFNLLQKKANKEISGKTFYSKNKKHKLKINNVEFFGANNVQASTIIVGVDFKGKVRGLFRRNVKGKIWFTIFPEYDIEQNLVYLKDLKITPVTNNVITNKAVPWLLNQFYMKELLEKTKIDFTDEIDNYKNIINNKISKIDLGKLTIKGKVSDLKFKGFNITKEEVILLVTANGKLDTESISLD